MRRQQHAGRAEPALSRVAFDEGRLQVGKLAALRQAFDGVDRPAGDLGRQRETASNRAAVEEHGARATDAVLAAEMRSGQFEVLAQEIGQMLARLRPPFQRLSVEDRLDDDILGAEEIRIGHGAGLSERELRTRRVSTVAM